VRQAAARATENDLEQQTIGTKSLNEIRLELKKPESESNATLKHVFSAAC
jgi:hypothetical protein